MKEQNVISITKLKNILQSLHGAQNNLNILENESFHLVAEDFPHYVEPSMTPQPTSRGITPFNEAKIILISAPGATGKSVMTQHLSYVCKIPVFNLAAHEPVGSYSLVGMLYQTLCPDDLGMFVAGLKNGTRTIIIDALDEGKLKTGQAAFDSFLQDIANMAKDSQGIPFVCFGRTAALEYVSLFLEELDVPVSMLQIEPFTIEQAKLFIDYRVGDKQVNKYADDYRKTRDYIIGAIGGFFKNESEMSKNAFENFIGYAPVLIAISTLLGDNKNYHALLNEMLNSNNRNVKLVVDILRKILLREREKLCEPIRMILAERSEEFKNQVLIDMYGIEEQCARLMYKCCKKKYYSHLTNDEDFNEQYNKFITDWEDQHPFADQSGKADFANVVFQSFCMVELLKDDSTRNGVIDYLSENRQKRNSYLLYFFYKEICGTNNELNINVLPYLIESFQLMDRLQNKGRVEILAEDDVTDDNQPVVCEVEFSKGSESEITLFCSKILPSEVLMFRNDISNLVIDAPINLAIEKNSLEIVAPIAIQCKSLKILSSEMRLTSYNTNDRIVIESPVITSSSSTGEVQSIVDKGNVKTSIITDSVLYFPIVKYREDLPEKLIEDQVLLERYQKLRRIILHFRSHSKGVLAKYKEKIDNRIGRKPLGRKVLSSLIDKGVIYEKNLMYYIEEEKFSDVLGVNFSGIRTYELSDKITAFLNSIE